MGASLLLSWFHHISTAESKKTVQQNFRGTACLFHVHSKASQNKYVFIRNRNPVINVLDRISAGSLFHVVGAMTLKACDILICIVFVGNNANISVVADWSVYVSALSLMYTARYDT